MNNPQPLVTIIVNTFNYGNFITDAVQSVLDQSYGNCEIIVVDDGSTDNTKEMLSKFLGRIKYIYQKNSGLASARNTGIRNASGQYIQFLDADDVLFQDKIEWQVAAMIKENSIISYCEIVYRDMKTGACSLNLVGNVKDLFSSLYLFWKPYAFLPHSLLIKKEAFLDYGLFNEDFLINDDRYFLTCLAHAGIQFQYVPMIGGEYRSHASNFTKKALLLFRDSIKYFEKIQEIVPESHIKGKYGYSSSQMKSANMTFLYFNFVRFLVPKSLLGEIRKELKQKAISFFASPIPVRIRWFKLPRLFLHAYLSRYFKIGLDMIRIKKS